MLVPAEKVLVMFSMIMFILSAWDFKTQDTQTLYLLVPFAFAFYKNGYTVSSLYFERLNYIKPGAHVCQQLH
jgi:hypothetical protein